jgi:DNA-binding NarL/FixJ family response regulator
MTPGPKDSSRRKYHQTLDMRLLMVKILIADGKKLFRESLKYVVENKGVMKVVGLAADGNEAYERCIKYKPDIILMDIAIPKYDGVEVTKLIKSKIPNIKILLLAAEGNENSAKNALYYGADGYITKNSYWRSCVLRRD